MKQRRRSMQRFLVEGRRLTVEEISARYGVPGYEFRQRVNKLGWTPLRAATAPIRQTPTYLIDGRELTRQQIHRRYHVHPSAFTRRLKSGKTPTEAVRMGDRERKYRFRGSLLTITQAAKRWGIPRDTIKARLLTGWSPDRAVRPVASAPRYLVRGERLTARQVVARYKVSRPQFMSRLNRGWTATRAATEPRRGAYKIDGEWVDMKTIAERYGISRHRFGYRLRSLGWSAQRAATTPIPGPMRVKVHDELLTYREIEARFNVSAGSFRQRLKHGSTPEQAVATPTGPSNRNKPASKVRLGGKTMTVKEVAALIGNVGPWAIRARIRRGMPIEQAVMEPTQRPRRQNRRRGRR